MDHASPTRRPRHPVRHRRLGRYTQALGGSNEIEHFLAPVFAATGSAPEAVAQTSHTTELGLAAISVLVAFAGLGLAYLWYYRKPGTAGALAEKFSPVYTLVSNKFYVDEIYNTVFVAGLFMFTRIVLAGLGELLVDGFGKFTGWVAFDFGEVTRRIQSGNLRSYAGWLALGAAAVMAVMIFGKVWMHS